MRDGGEKVQNAHLSEMREKHLFKGLRGIKSWRVKTEIVERNVIFPTNPNSTKTEFPGKKYPIFHINHNLTPY